MESRLEALSKQELCRICRARCTFLEVLEVGICITVYKVKKNYGSSRGQNQRGDFWARWKVDPLSSGSSTNETVMKFNKPRDLKQKTINRVQ